MSSQAITLRLPTREEFREVFLSGTGDRTRTYTSEILDPKSSASTNSATPASKTRPKPERAAKVVLLNVTAKHHLISIMFSIRSISVPLRNSRILAIAGNISLSEGSYSTLVVRVSSGSSVPPPESICNSDNSLATGYSFMRYKRDFLGFFHYFCK